MLDSTGPRFRREIRCSTCEKIALQYTSYLPRYGHAGNPLDVGACIDKSPAIKNLQGAKLYKVLPGTLEARGTVQLGEARLYQSSEPYHYGGLREPNFGNKIGSVIFICKACVSHYGESLESRIQVIYEVQANIRYAGILNFIFLLDALVSSQTLKRRLARVDKHAKERFFERLTELIEEIRQFSPTDNNQEILGKLEQLAKMVAKVSPSTTP